MTLVKSIEYEWINKFRLSSFLTCTMVQLAAYYLRAVCSEPCWMLRSMCGCDAWSCQ